MTVSIAQQRASQYKTMAAEPLRDQIKNQGRDGRLSWSKRAEQVCAGTVNRFPDNPRRLTAVVAHVPPLLLPSTSPMGTG